MWPTWADIIGHDLSILYYNWGLIGTGNVAIFHKMLECDLKYRFNSTDLILVNWSSWPREDRLDQLGAWLSGGNIFNNTHYGSKFVNTYWNDHNDIVKNASSIIAVNKMFNLNFQSHMIDYETDTEYKHYQDPYTFNKYDYLLTNMPKKIIFDTSKNSKFNNKVTDRHPDILCHLNHVYTIYKDLNLTIRQATLDKYRTMQQNIINQIPTQLTTWNTTCDFFKDNTAIT